jgi:hypothetical protein
MKEVEINSKKGLPPISKIFTPQIDAQIAEYLIAFESCLS